MNIESTTPIFTAPEPLAEMTPPRRQRMLWLLSAAVFLIFFQGFMVAPLIPRLALLFGVSVQSIGVIVPAYLLAYGVATLVYGPLSDRRGRLPVILTALLIFVVLTGLTALVHSSSQMVWIRLITGFGAGGVTPLAVSLIGDLFPYRERGQALGLLFGALAGGMAFGSTVGALLEPWIGWRCLFLIVAIFSAMVAGLLLPYRNMAGANAAAAESSNFFQLLRSMGELLHSRRGRRIYGYVVLNGLFHSGVYTWLGYYFVERYHLGEVGIGLALLGYGVPGFLFGPLIGRMSDRWGRSWMIPGGLAIAGFSCLAFVAHLPVWVAAILVTFISLGCDTTQPLLAAIATDLTHKRGMAVGLFAFALFTGFGLGSFVFGEALRYGLDFAFTGFGGAAIMAAAVGALLFREE